MKTQSKREVEELMALHRESRELRPESSPPGPGRAAPEAEGSGNGARGVASAPTEEAAPWAEAEELFEIVAARAESLGRELEEAATERPLLALLAAFGIGVVVGRLTTRR